MVSQTIRLPDELAARLEKLARATGRSKNACIVEALEHHLKECEDLEIAISRFRDPDAAWVEHDDVRKQLGFDSAYREMAADAERETEALTWVEGLIGDATDNSR